MHARKEPTSVLFINLLWLGYAVKATCPFLISDDVSVAYVGLWQFPICVSVHA
ncbi:hypothetical protein DL89DRAFT_268808 [Linderina pennispora]|uniref:Uncharacterized protein n=1 Tax=Linderina pennispora TaxID=61395 RepID=A0A1Y1W4I4_9FUNG|nr:uncharacterized protein DL89DRAFT_268808 [Linderina pennispora]ORX68292.1 hypothetical protein DL89DRAFT_268808 [Linderina pennispora]